MARLYPGPAALVVAALLLAGCGTKLDAVQLADSGTDATSTDGAAADAASSADARHTTYVGDIKEILDNHCISCHSSLLSGVDRNGAPAGVNLDTYAGASASAELANGRIQSGTMPPATSGVEPVSEADRLLFQAWVDQGTPEQ